MDFETEYLPALVKHEREKAIKDLADPRQELMTLSGIHLDWVADYVSNPAMKWELQTLPIDSIALTGTSAAWNQILI